MAKNVNNRRAQQERFLNIGKTKAERREERRLERQKRWDLGSDQFGVGGGIIASIAKQNKDKKKANKHSNKTDFVKKGFNALSSNYGFGQYGFHGGGKAEQIYKVAEEIFGGRYWCVKDGDKAINDDTDNIGSSTATNIKT